MGEKLFHRALFGYRRKDVNAYFESVSEKFAEEGRAKDAELARLRDALASAEREADALRGLREEFENSRNSISKAIIDAETNAVRIIEEAKKSAVEEKRKVQNEIAEEAANLRRLRQDAAYLRRGVTALIHRFDGDVQAFSDDGGGDATNSPA